MGGVSPARGANLRDIEGPLWARSGVVVWSEDDALTHDRERVCEAWARLFGEPLDIEQAVAHVDYTDSCALLMPNGHAVWFDCGLACIERCRVLGIIEGRS